MTSTGNVAHPKRNLPLAVLVALVFLASLGWLLFGRPAPRPLVLILVAAAALSFAGLVTLFLPTELTPKVKRFVGASVAAATLIVAYLAVPGIVPPTASGPATVGASPASASSAPSTELSPTAGGESTSSEAPFTAILQVDLPCESLVIDNSLINQIPNGDEFDAQWAYDRGGSTGNKSGRLTIQGETDDLVILHGIHVVSYSDQPPTEDASLLQPCDPQGGSQQTRSFSVQLEDQPRIVSQPAFDPDHETGKIQPASKFPYKVSRTDAEVWDMYFSGPPCRCSFELEIDWTSRGKSGRLKVARDFGSPFVIHTGSYELPFYHRDPNTGVWDPPLPE